MVINENADSVYLYNSYSGAFAKLEKEVYESINGIIEDNLPGPYFEDLLKQGFIKPLELNEFNKILLIERSAIFEQSEENLTFVIAPTLTCNLNCTYCFERTYRHNVIMSEQTLTDIIGFIQKKLSSKNKKLHITWFGGEPLLAYKLILKFNQELKELIKDKDINYSSSMITNGILLTEERVKALSEFGGLKKVQITIDGTEEVYCNQKNATPKQFQQVLKNIKEALQYIKVTVRLNCNKDNFDNIKKVVYDLVEYCGINDNLDFYLAKLIDYNCVGDKSCFEQDEFDLKFLEFKKYLCSVLHKEFKPDIPKYRKSFCGLFKLKNLVIGPQGELYKCEHFVGRDDKVIGNVKQGLFYTDEMLHFINNEVKEKCKACKIFPLCIGGCPAQKQDLLEGQSCYYSEGYIKQLLLSYMK